MILSLMSFFLVASFYHGNLGPDRRPPAVRSDPDAEKLPGNGPSGIQPFKSPYHEAGR
jgi:hypothetical protein